MQNSILIFSINKYWNGISRLPAGLKRADFRVYALCPKNSYLSQTRYVDHLSTFNTFMDAAPKTVILRFFLLYLFVRPNIVMLGDEDALQILQEMCRFLCKIPFLKKIGLEMRASLCREEFDNTVLNKDLFLATIKKWGIPTPADINVTTFDEAKKVALELKYPVVLKKSTSYGGSGVFICKNEEDLNKAFYNHIPKNIKKRIKRFIKSQFFIDFLGSENRTSIQQYIQGAPGIAPFAAKDGKLLAATVLEKVIAFPAVTGPASVIKTIDRADIISHVKTLVNNLGYNGFGGMEYIIDQASGKFYVIEMNPRCTPLHHIDEKYLGVDLCMALKNGIEKKETNFNWSFKPFTITLFPNELRRDPNSSYLTANYHDLPINDPNLTKILMPVKK